MAEAIVKISKGLLEAAFLPTGTIIEEIKDMGQYLECVVRGPTVPDGCKQVRVRTSQTREFVPVDS